MSDYANILQLVILSNFENRNANMIEQGLEQKILLENLNLIVKKSKCIKKIENLNNTFNLANS